MTLIRVCGKLNDQRLTRYRIALNRAVKEGAGRRHLVDVREVSCTKRLSVRGVTEYAKREPDQPKSSIALLVGDSAVHYGMARAYQTFASEKRMAVEIFQEKDAALAWVRSEG